MTDRLLHKYTGRSTEVFAEPAATPVAEAEGTDDLGAFGWLRGVRERAVMLELRKKTGDVLAIGYNWIERVEFDPSEGITLHALGRQLRIKGRRLNSEVRPLVRLFAGIVRHRVPWVQEADGRGSFGEGGTTPLIDAIDW